MIIDCKDCSKWVFSPELTAALSKNTPPTPATPLRPGTTTPAATTPATVRKGTCRSHSPGPGHEPNPKERLVYYPITNETGDGCASGEPID